MSSSDVTEAEKIYFTHEDNELKLEEQTLEGKEQLWKISADWVANEEATLSENTVTDSTSSNITGTSLSIHRVSQNTRKSGAKHSSIAKDMIFQQLGEPDQMTKCY